MKMRKWLAVAVLMALPVYVWAQVVAQDGNRTDPGRRGTGQGMLIGGINRSDTTMVLQTYNSDGSVVVKEAAPIFDQNGVAMDVINHTGIAAGAADSNATPVDTHGWRVTGLLIKATPAGGTGRVNRLAFQIRAHLNNLPDSSSVFAWYPEATLNMGAAATAAEDTTISVGHQVTGSATAQWSGEFVVIVNGIRNAPGDGVAATAFSYPNGIYVPLSNFFGTDFWAPHTSIRVRNLVGPTCAVRVHLIGTPL